jgi:diguanylate cyclase (GGDEF)-like protein/PAS domain S-box-containing protein
MNVNRNSLKFIISIGFVSLISITFTVIGVIIFSSWGLSTRKVIAQREREVTREIITRIEAVMDVMEFFGKSNRDLVANHIVNLRDLKERERFFAGVLQSEPVGIHQLGYGTKSGAYYGAQRNLRNEIEILRNDGGTGGKLWRLTLGDNLAAGAVVGCNDDYDPRRQEWYQAVQTQHGPTFSPFFQQFGKNDLAIAAAYPVYNEAGLLEGVFEVSRLLSDINRYLNDIAADRKVDAYIVEKKSGKLVANSLGKPVFRITDDNQIKRTMVGELGLAHVSAAYREYLQNSVAVHRRIKVRDDMLRLGMTEYRRPGLDWVIITAVPEKQFTVGIKKSIYIAVGLSLIALFGAVLIHLKGIAVILKPVDNLINTAEKFAKGDFSQRVAVGGNDEIGKLATAFNQMAAELDLLVNNLETEVCERTRELNLSNEHLRKSKEEIQLLLDSTGEAIFGVDIRGNCTFCNASCLRMLGYQHQDDLIGKKVHDLLHRQTDGSPPSSWEKCPIFQGIVSGKGSHITDELFWRSDGVAFSVECFSYPQYREGKIIGGVVTFFDITERKKREAEIIYLSYRDQLTGLYNRRFFEMELKRQDVAGNYPLTIVYGDMNGLKLINDSLGHTMGDELLKKVAEVLVKSCRKSDIVARLGGDEFVVILPQAGPTEAERVVKRIKTLAAATKVQSLELSISCGYSTKFGPEESLAATLKKAEDYMYKHKLFESPSVRGKTVNVLLSTIYEKSRREEAHSRRVSQLCSDMGEALHLFEHDREELKTAGLLHDIGKVAVSRKILEKRGKLSAVDWKEVRHHPEVGYRILSTVNDLAELAEYVVAHHERWDGQGYPKGLAGEAIPLQARIIAIAEAYDVMTNADSYRKSLSPQEAIKELQSNAGTQFDPWLTEAFVAKVLKNQGEFER